MFNNCILYRTHSDEIQIALMVLSAAGFGIPLSWRQDEKPAAGHKLTFTQTLQAQAEGRLLRRATSRLPGFILRYFKRAEKAHDSDREMRVCTLTCSTSFRPYRLDQIYLSEIILERQKAADKEDRSDVLTNLIKGGEESKEGFPALTVSELMG